MEVGQDVLDPRRVVRPPLDPVLTCPQQYRPCRAGTRFSCPADPLTPAAGRGAGPSKSSGSSKRNWELCDDSTTETSAGLSKSVSTTVVGPSTVTGPSPVAEPSPVAKPSPVAGPLPVAELSPVAGPLPVAEPWPVVGSLPVTVPLRAAVTSLVAEPPLAAGPAPAEPSIAGAGTGTAGAGTGTAGADSKWICRAGEATTVIVRFSGALGFAGDSWTSRLATNAPPVLSELSLSFLPHCFRRGSGLTAISLCYSLGLRCPSFWQPILTH